MAPKAKAFCCFFIFCHLNFHSQCSIIMATHPLSFLLMFLLLFSSLLICFCLVIASTFSCLLLLVMSLTSWFLLTAFSCACFLAFAAPSLIVVSMYIMYSDFPKQRIIVNSLLTFVLLSRDFKSHCLINLCSDFSFGSGCLLVV